MTPRKKKLKQRRNLVSISGDDWGKLPNTIRRWFDNALRTDDPKPSFEACFKLARAFQIILNRHNNAELERIAELEGRPVDLSKLKDVSWAELEAKKFWNVMDAANHLMARAEELGGFVWTSGVTLEDITQILEKIGAYPKALAPSAVMRRGRPKEAWHSVVRDIAHAIIRTMREAEYKGTLSVKNEDAVTAIVGAELIKLAFGVRVGAAGFISAVRNRDRTTRGGTKSFFERYPDAARIRILD